ncbi:hypothetical protein [Sphingobacterium mizutaii]|nr:hypothetical protein [Sphingobacterium mizutaii]MBV2226707.1 hypothetical protein [Sphingobacterium mizutaii]
MDLNQDGRDKRIDQDHGMNQDWVPLRSPNEDGRIDHDYDQHFAGKSIIL